ncbi:hypothetical protein SAMN06265350_101111 [Solitalea koreensis]|uniref:Uncharacterized protein n=2 Tax=Solitalea koreensis TaxID=543615 RepID=A0A521AG03_9SPHI|nr:hypothetical protein SAMN06265350_101111 [Solitalea koreensis]
MTLSSFAQSNRESLINSLDSCVISRSQEVGFWGGEIGHPPEIFAFNIIYKSPYAGKKFKEIYPMATISGKFYCVIGLFLLTDSEYEKYKTDFISLKTTEPIYFRVGCKLMKYESQEKLLKQWMEAYDNKVWYTKIVL